MTLRLSLEDCTMKTKLALMFALCASALFGGQERLVSIDLARKNQSLSLIWTEMQNTAVRVSVKDNGSDFNLDGWDGFLVLGGGKRGLVVEGVREGYGDFVFRVDQSAMPTNGKYTVQITAQRGYHTEEWASGVVRVQMNPGVDYLPTCWMGYERVAKLAALYIGTNDVRRAVDEIVGADFELDCVTRTNAAVVVQVSKVQDIHKGSRFAFNRPNGGEAEFKNVDYPDIRIYGGTNAASSVIEVMTTGTTYAPTNINGKVWHRNAESGGMVYMADCLVTNNEKIKAMGGVR